MEPVKLDREKIRKLLLGIRSLDRKQRELTKETLERLARSSDGRVSPEELHRALRELRRAYKISDLDAEAVERAVFE